MKDQYRAGKEDLRDRQAAATWVPPSKSTGSGEQQTGGSYAPPMTRRDPQQVTHDDSQPPTRDPAASSAAAAATTESLAGREGPREEAESVREIRGCDGDYAEEGEADEGV